MTLHRSSLPPVYAALLSQVAHAFRTLIVPGTHTKESLEYKDSFLGLEAVNTLCQIIKTNDRNLALLVGRTLDAQGFFHDVTYSHRLRDSRHELYQFRKGPGRTAPAPALPSHGTLSHAALRPNGVFVLLTDCYAPTCSRDRLCYSVACPRRLEQRTRMMSSSATAAAAAGGHGPTDQLWSETVPESLLATLSPKDRNRQEVIFELIKTEAVFVADMEFLMKAYEEPLRTQEIIPMSTREAFVRKVFHNVRSIIVANTRLLKMLQRRQKESLAVDKIGDIMVVFSRELHAFVEYGANQPWAKHALDLELDHNTAFSEFCRKVEKMPESHRLPIQSFLARPTTRVGRYPLLLEGVLKHTPKGHSDQRMLPEAVKAIKETLSRINAEAGKADNLLKLQQIKSQLIWHPGEFQDLRLQEQGRQFVRDGTLILKRGNDLELHVFLFDHCLLLTKKKKNGMFKVWKKPIPLELLTTSSRSMAAPPRRPAAPAAMAVSPHALSHHDDDEFTFAFVHLGRAGGQYLLQAATPSDCRAWMDVIAHQKRVLTERKRRFKLFPLMDTSWARSGIGRITCSAVWGSRLILGTDQGIYTNVTIKYPTFTRQWTRALAVEHVAQIDLLLPQGTLLVLAEKTLLSFNLEMLNPKHLAQELRGRKVASHVSFFKVGTCGDRQLLCIVKSTALSSTVKVLEPGTAPASKRKNGMLGGFFRGSPDTMRVFKEFYIPAESSSLHFLRSKLCVGCARGFEIVDLDSLDTQGLLDPSDPRLDFALRRSSDGVRPMAIFRATDGGDFLLCYSDFGFYVNKLGRRARDDWIVYWSGQPAAFAVVHPFVIALEPAFIEVRHMETGHLQQILPVSQLRVLTNNGTHLHACVRLRDAPLQPEVQAVLALRSLTTAVDRSLPR
ncbi:hypothetical protein CXG81DRAFT_15300 [Caulochytrium protostelioides]|uniref:CNH-domain-containing protein n=1 Tax=Caulochytrium protostelioides TaxID=1555241 RepID=A0A4P9X1G3_9FUNG|nr:hypothetical protein CXG81DRAFT_15300 [Caulochytrium protostelioides]|eukprot:RKO98905.1 hypothetical protein CXG81DRAFT_15300 [Caulochytrium protostelioides]